MYSQSIKFGNKVNYNNYVSRIEKQAHLEKMYLIVHIYKTMFAVGF